MKRLRLMLAYDGTPFQGWQSQPCGNTVQDFLENTVQEIAGIRVRVHGSGRTDTGVHALGQVAHFELTENISMDAGDWQRALNALLPSSIRILHAEPAEDTFHARFSALGKTYQYEIDCGGVLHPLRCNRTLYSSHGALRPHLPTRVPVILRPMACLRHQSPKASAVP